MLNDTNNVYTILTLIKLDFFKVFFLKSSYSKKN